MYDVELIDGDLPEVTNHISGWRLTIQRVQIRLGTFFGEWFLDTGVGMPFFNWIETKPAPVDEISATVRLEAEAVDGVVRVDEVITTFNPQTQAVTTTARIIIQDDVLAEEVAVGVRLDATGQSIPQFAIIYNPQTGIVP